MYWGEWTRGWEPTQRAETDLTVAGQGDGVAADHAGVLADPVLGVLGAAAQTTARLAGGGEPAQLAVLVDGVADPVDPGVVADGVVVGVNQDHLEELVAAVLVDPVAVEDPQVAADTADALLGDRAQVALGLDLVDTVVGGLAVDNALVVLALAVAAAHANPVDDVALLGLVAQAAGLVRAGRPGGPVDHGQVPELPDADALQEAQDVALLLLPQLLEVLVGSCGGRRPSIQRENVCGCCG